MPDHPNSQETPLGAFQLSLFCRILCNLNFPRLGLRPFSPGRAAAGAVEETSSHLTTPTLQELIEQGDSFGREGLDRLLGKNFSLKG